MAIQCADTDTLVQTYLDGELAGQDAAMLQHHLVECSSCNVLAAEEARAHAQLREKLAPPPAPPQLRERLLDALDSEDARTRQSRPPTWHWTLPAASSLAAAAALLFFIVSNDQQPSQPEVMQDAVWQHMRRPPIEADGVMAPVFVQQHVSRTMRLPRFSDNSTSLRGARLSHLGGRDAAQVFYQTRVGNRLYDVSALMFDASDLRLCNGRVFDIGGREVCVTHRQGFHVATHKDDDGIGYVFISEMDALTLLDFVKTSDLFLRASEKRHRALR